MWVTVQYTTVCCTGAESRGEPAAFAVKFYGYPSQLSVPKKLRVFICRCGQLLSHGKAPLETAIRGRAAKKGHSMRTTYSRRRRRHGFQGRPVLCTELRQELFQWFLCIRKAIKGRVWGRHVIRAAERIKKRLVKHYLERKLNVPSMPKITPGWVWRWARDFNICMRKPNRRYKVSRSKIKSGLTVTWKTFIGPACASDFSMGRRAAPRDSLRILSPHTLTRNHCISMKATVRILPHWTLQERRTLY